MNLISGTHHLCERREHAFMILQEYTIISHSITIGDRDKVLRTSTIYFLKVFNSEREFWPCKRRGIKNC